MRMAGWIVAVWVAAGMMVAAPASADWPDRLYVLLPTADLGGFPPPGSAAGSHRFIQDLAEAADGSALLGTARGWPPRDGEVLRLGRDGSLRTVGSLPDGLRAIAAGDDGSVLVLQDSRVLRLLPSGESSVLAGTGQAGFSGDGGPATSAALDVGSDQGAGGGIVELADGSIVFTDSSNDRVRRIRPDGVIETIAGTGAPGARPDGCALPQANGDGGPARSAALCVPSDVVVAAGGGYIVADTRGDRVRRIAPDGTISTIAGGGLARADRNGSPATDVNLSSAFPRNVVQLPDGTVVVSLGVGYGRIGTDGRWSTLFEDLGGAGADFTRRGPGVTSAITHTREGGLLIGSTALYELAPPGSAHLLAHIRGARVDDERVALSVDISNAANVTLRVRRRGRTVASATRRLDAGRRRIAVRGRFTARPHRVRVTLRGPGGAASADEVLLHLGGRLTRRAARAAIEAELVEGTIRSCRRMTRRRIGCTIVADGARFTWTARLGRAGVVRLVR